MFKGITFCILFFLLTIGPAYAATIYVPDDYPTIQGAINASVNHDTIIVRPGTYVENIDFIGKAITVLSEQGAAVTTIDGSKAGRVVRFKNGEGRNSVLDGFSVTNGGGPSVKAGGGIDCDASATIKNNIIRNNDSTWDGGGIYCTNNPLIIGNIIIENTSGHGGGISCETLSTPTIDNNIIANNTASNIGGGILFYYSYGIASNNTIIDNSANNGGGIYSTGGTVATIIINNSIINNSAFTYGGGIHIRDSSGGMVKGNIISNNTSNDHGGGIDSASNSIIFTDNIISGNISNRGGGYYCTYDSSNIINNTIVENQGIKGGGIFSSYSSSQTITSTILWKNNAPEGPEIWVGETAKPATLTISYSNVEGGQSSCYVDPGCTLNWNPGMIDADPLVVDPVNGDFHLTFLSPCRGSGDNSGVTELYDFEGDPRIAFGRVDMGADEFYTHLYVIGDQTPGGAIQGKFVGLPGTTPVGLFIGSGILPSPMNTMWGEFWLQAPWFLFGPLGAIPANGVMVLPATLPPGMTVPVDIPMQALIGLNPDSLTNLCVIEVR